MKPILMLLLVWCSASHTQPNVSSTNNPLLGAWHLTGVEWRSAERNSALTDVQPGLFVFTEHHYALMWSPVNQPREAFQVLAKPTDEEIIKGFKSVIFNGGSYRYADGKLVTTAEVAKVPGFETGQQFFKVSLANDQLTLTFHDEVYPDGTQPEWAGTWETVFTLQKADH